MKEIWKFVPGYDFYKASNMGRIKSIRFGRDRILKPSLCDRYYRICLTSDKKRKGFYIHQLIALAFIGEPKGLDVDHIDENKLNNKLSNLRYLKHRLNVIRAKRNGSKYKSGVYLSDGKYWCSQIMINGKREQLGTFKTEEEAHQAYLNKVMILT